MREIAIHRFILDKRFGWNMYGRMRVLTISILFFAAAISAENCNESEYKTCVIEFGHCFSAAPSDGFKCVCLSIFFDCMRKPIVSMIRREKTYHKHAMH